MLSFTAVCALMLQTLWEYLSPKYSPMTRCIALVAGLLTIPALYTIALSV